MSLKVVTEGIKPLQLVVVTDTGGVPGWKVGELIVGVELCTCDGAPTVAASLGDGRLITRYRPGDVISRPLDHRTDEVYLDEHNRLQVRPKPPAPVTWDDLEQGDYFTDADGTLCVKDDEGGYTSLRYADGGAAGVTHDDENFWLPFTRRTPAEAAAIIAGGSPDVD